MAAVVALGWACLDQRYWVARFPPTQARTEARRYREALGGPAAVAALTAARLGGDAAFVGRRGRDPTGKRLDALLRADGVDTAGFAAFSAAETPVSAVLIAPDGERHIFRYGGRLPADPAWVGPHAPARGVVLVDLRWPEGALALTRQARARGLPVVVDLDRDDEAAWTLAGLATHAVADAGLAARAGGPDTVLSRLSRAGTWGAVTLGAEGVVHAEGRLPAFAVEVADSTGAGDVFHGAFALALAEGETETEALRFASAAGALRCKLADVPRRTALAQWLEERA